MSKIKRIFKNFIDLFKYPRIHKLLSKKRNLYFFFPTWSFGGAERVHIDILNLFKDHSPLCFITGKSITNGFKKEFESAADVLNLGRWSEKKAYKLHLLKKIAKTINNQKQPVISGWCSQFMYDLIPYLDAHVQVTDIIHNFTDDGKGIEFYSLPYVPRLDKRIIVGNQLLEQFRELYKTNHIPEHYLERLTVIQNKINFDNFFPKKNYDKTLQVLFVSRNSPEKRPNVLFAIAQKCEELNLPIEFKIIGNFIAEDQTLSANIEIIGVVKEKSVMDTYYKQAHLLALTSYRESWGLVVFEGMNFGVVPLSTNVGELAQYISPEKQNGVLLENLSVTDDLVELFVQELQRFINDRNLLKKFSENAFETVKKLAEECNFDAAYKNALQGKIIISTPHMQVHNKSKLKPDENS